MSTNKFLNTGGSGGGDITNGSLNVFASTLKAENLEPSKALKTNSVSQLISANLDIADINNLQSELDNSISNPFNGTLVATDFKSDNINSVETVIEQNQSDITTLQSNDATQNVRLTDLENLTVNIDGNNTNLTNTAFTSRVEATDFKSSNIASLETVIEQNQSDIATLQGEGGSISTRLTDLETLTQNIDSVNTDNTQTFFNGRLVADDLAIPNFGSVKDRLVATELKSNANEGNIADNNTNININAGNITSLENLTQNIDSIATDNTQTTFNNLITASDLQTDNITSLEAKITELENESGGNDTAITNLQAEQVVQNNRLDTLEDQNQNQTASTGNTVFVGDIQKRETRNFTNNTTTDSSDQLFKLYDGSTGNTFSLGGVQSVSFDVNYIKQFKPSGSIRFTSGGPDNFTCDFEQTLLNNTVVTDTPTNETSFTLSRNIEEIKGLVCRNISNPEGFGTDLSGIFINGERLLDGTFDKSVLTEKDIDQNTNDIATLQEKTSPLIDDGNVLTVRKDSANISLVPRGITDGIANGFLRGGITIQGISNAEYPLISYNVWDGSGGTNTGDVVNFFCQNEKLMSLTNDTTPNRMTVEGDVFGNSFQNVSDERLKTNIIPLDDNDAINMAKDIEPICYDFHGSAEIGFSSQNLQSVESKIVTVTDIERNGVPNLIFVKPTAVCAIAISSIKQINERTPVQGSFVFSANSVLYNDNNIELLWDGVNKQPQFRSTQSTFHDGFITFSKPYGSGVVSTGFSVSDGATLNYFNDGGVRDASFDADQNFGAEFKISIRCDTDGEPMYLFNLFIGNCEGTGNNGFYEAKKIKQ